MLIVGMLMTLGTTALAAEPRPSDFGKQWVRSHPFTISALTLRPSVSTPDGDFDLKQYKDAGLNAMMLWKPKPGNIRAAISADFPIHMHVRRNSPIDLEAAKAFIDQYATEVPCIEGWMLCDEPRIAEVPQVAELVNWVRAKYPDKLVYSNMGGDGSQWEYVQAFTKTIRPDVMSCNIYPFRKGILTRDIFFGMLEIRKASLEAGLPYWAFIQAWQDKSGAEGANRTPSESELRMQVYAHLAAGFTGIVYFTYDDAQGPAMVEEGTNKPNPIYYQVQALNGEVANLGETLKMLTSTNVCFLRSQNSTMAVPTFFGETGRKMSRQMGVVDVEEGLQQGQDSQISTFQDDNGVQYFMIVNLWSGPELDASKATRLIHLTLAPDAKDIYRINRKTGQTELMKPVDGKIAIELPGGTGDLFRVGGD